MKKIFLLFIILSSWSMNHLWAAFKDGNISGARPAALGGAFLAIADDINSMIHNPAGIAQVEKRETLFTYAEPYAGLDLGETSLSHYFAAIAYPIPKAGTIALGWKNLNITDLYQENSLLLTYGLEITKFLDDSLEQQIYAGVNLKYLYYNFQLDQRSENDPVFLQGTDNNNIAADLGIYIKKVFESLPDLAMGCTIKNINQPDMGLLEKEPVYREYGFGLAYIWHNFTFKKPSSDEENNEPKLQTGSGNDIIFSAEFAYRNNELNVKGGTEISLFKRILSLRLGGNFNEFSAGTGTRIKMNPFLLHLDYGFSYPLSVAGSYGSHQLSLNIKF